MRGAALSALLVHSHLPRHQTKRKFVDVQEIEMPHSVEGKSTVRIVPIVHAKDKSNVKFAAEVYGVDLNNFSGMFYCVNKHTRIAAL